MTQKQTRSLARLLVFAALLCCFPLRAHAREQTVDILLIGQDGREGLEGSRSDAMILCSYNPDCRQLTLVSFLRDLYLPIPGRGSDRLNAAYAWGGAPLLKKTLEENFGLTVDGTVEVDFDSFSRIVDALGGVRITLREDEARQIRSSCPGSTVGSGEQLLTGPQALCYARIRDLDPDGDFSRTRRQRCLLQSVVSAWKDAELSVLLNTLGALLPLVKTDLSPVQLLDWICSAAPGRRELKLCSIQIPRKDLCRDQTVDAKAVILCDLEQNRLYLHQTLYPT